MRFWHLGAALIVTLVLGTLPGEAEQLFDEQQVSPGVYAAIARTTFRPNCNAVIVLLEDSVLVVDTEAKPSAAREVIGYIKRLTPNPVRYIVITHFHADHTQGAETYLKEWPDAEIVATEATRESIPLRGQARMKFEAFNVPRQIQKLEADISKNQSEEEKATLETRLAEANIYRRELGTMHIALPTMTIDRELRLEDRAHPVEALYLGKAHTNGDLFVFLPKDKILISGDALQSLTPTMRDCYPDEWIRTLQAAEKLDFDTVIGGHGEPFHGKETLRLWEQYFRDLLQQAADSFASGATLDETRRKLVPALVAKYGDRFPKRFSETVVSNVERAYRYESGSTE